MDALNKINQGVEIASELAQIAAPFVSIAFPAEGAAMAAIAPLVKSMVVKEGQIIANMNTSMSRDDLISVLEASKSVNWPKPIPIVP
jgi:hypothetical protein